MADFLGASEYVPFSLGSIAHRSVTFRRMVETFASYWIDGMNDEGKYADLLRLFVGRLPSLEHLHLGSPTTMTSFFCATTLS